MPVGIITVLPSGLSKDLVWVKLSRTGTRPDTTDVKNERTSNDVEIEAYGFTVSEEVKTTVFQYCKKVDDDTVLPNGIFNVFKKLKLKFGFTVSKN